MALNQLTAACRFLQNCSGLKNFSVLISKQREIFLSLLSQGPRLDAEEAAQMSELLQKSFWSVEDREVMLSAVASKVEAAHAKRVRRPMQDYTTLPHFLPSELWAEITTQSETADKRLHMLCQHASLLGLKYPSENTVGVIIGLCMHKQLTSASPLEMHEQFTAYKSQVRRFLQPTPAEPFLEKLPESPQDLPEQLWQRSFAASKPVPPAADVVKLLNTIRQIPLRRSNKNANSNSVDNVQGMFSMFCKFFQQSRSSGHAGDIPLQILRKAPALPDTPSSLTRADSSSSREEVQIQLASTPPPARALANTSHADQNTPEVPQVRGSPDAPPLLPQETQEQNRAHAHQDAMPEITSTETQEQNRAHAHQDAMPEITSTEGVQRTVDQLRSASSAFGVAVDELVFRLSCILILRVAARGR